MKRRFFATNFAVAALMLRLAAFGSASPGARVQTDAVEVDMSMRSPSSRISPARRSTAADTGITGNTWIVTCSP